MTKLTKLKIDRPFLQINNKLGESPLWNTQEQVLYWLDIELGQVHTFNPNSQDHKIYDLGKQAGSIAFTENDDLLIATTNGLAFWNKNEGLRQNFLDFFNASDSRMMNDGKVDTQGNYWVGSKGPKNASSLYQVKPNFVVRTMLDGLTISNGLDWAPKSDCFFHVDSGVASINRYRYVESIGAISDKELFYSTISGTPDGLTVDAFGNIWTAIWDGWSVIGLRPNGRKFCQIDLPVSRPTSVTFGGRDFTELFITSARTGLSDEALAQEPYAGSLFCIKLKTYGLPSNKFGVKRIPKLS